MNAFFPEFMLTERRWTSIANVQVPKRLLNEAKCSSRMLAKGVCRRGFQQEMAVCKLFGNVYIVHCRPLPLPQTFLGQFNAI